MKTLHFSSSVFYKIEEIGTNILLLFFFCFSPLFMGGAGGFKGGYYTAFDAKYSAFSWLAPPIFALFFLHLFLTREIHPSKKMKDRWMVFFAFSIILSSIVSVSLNSSSSFSILYGNDEWKMGMITWLEMIALFFLSKNYGKKEVIKVPAIVTGAVVCLVGILNRFSIDPLGIEPEAEIYHFPNSEFISTFGNIDWLGGYLALMIPLGMSGIVYADSRKQLVFAGVFHCVNMCMLMCLNADSPFLSLIAGSLFLVFAVRDEKQMTRWLWMLALAGLAWIVMQGLRCWLPAMAWEPNGIGYLLSNTYVPEVLEVVMFGIIAFRAVMKCENKYYLSLSKVKRMATIAVIAGCAAIAAGFVVFNTFNTVNLDGVLSKSLGNYFALDGWRRNRLIVWKNSFYAWRESSLEHPIRFLTGLGADQLEAAIKIYCPDSFDTIWAAIACAHCEPLNILCNFGVIGLTAYIGMLKSVFKESGMEGKSVILGSFANGLVSFATIMSTPLLFCVMGLLTGKKELKK